MATESDPLQSEFRSIHGTVLHCSARNEPSLHE